jgi:adenylate cyclase
VRGKRTTTEAPPERRLAAIMVADIDGYARLIRSDDEEMHRRVNQELDHLRSAILQASGTIFSFTGDGMMAEFSSATQALKCALKIQAAAARRMADAAEPIRFRMGINAGEILASKRHVGGIAINLAAGLERIAPPGGIALPGTLHDQLRHAVPVPATPMGQPDLRDLDEPVVAVAISSEACVAWATDTKPVRNPVAPKPQADPRAALAIVPFRATGTRIVFADSSTDGVIRALGGLATWLAVTRTQAASIHGPVDLHRIRQTCGARYILHGSVEAERGMLRLAVELNEAESGRVLWSDRFDHRVGEQAALRDDAVSRIARAIPPMLMQRELDRSRLAPPETLSAHDLALHAYAAIMEPERDWFTAAADMLRRAEQLAGPHASVRFVTIWWHLMAISQGWSTDPAADTAAAGRIASQLDRNDPAAMALQAFMQSVLHRDHAVASAMLDRAIDATPMCALAASLKGLTLGWLGQPQAAVFQAELAETMPALGPERAWRDHVIALTHYFAGSYGDAVRWARVSAMHHPGLAANVRVLAASLAVLGRLDEAQQAGQQMLAIDPQFRISAWRERSLFPEESRIIFAQRLRLAGLPG